jgi:hypothetical protein
LHDYWFALRTVECSRRLCNVILWPLSAEAATFCRPALITFKMKLCNTLIGLSIRFVPLSFV